jgi:hypothetical protein
VPGAAHTRFVRRRSRKRVGMEIDSDLLLHPRVRKHCEKPFSQRLFRCALSEAMLQVELALKEISETDGHLGFSFASALKGVPLRVPFGPAKEREARELCKSIRGYYRNYVMHDGREVDEITCIRGMVHASEVLDMLGATPSSLRDLGGLPGVVRKAGFSDAEGLFALLRFLDERVLPGEIVDGFFEDLAIAGYSDEQFHAVIEAGLVEYSVHDVEVPEAARDAWEPSIETVGWFQLTPLGRRLLGDEEGTPSN